MSDKSDDNVENQDQEKKPGQDEQLAGRIRGSARQIWLAGLGAFTKSEGDTGRFFERLVHEGEELESKTRGVVEKHVRSVEHRVEDVRDRATGTWDRLEHMFDERVSGALRRLGIYRSEDVEALEQRVSAMEEELRQLKAELGRDEEE